MDTTKQETHDLPDSGLGLPYAMAIVDEVGYAVVCPRCGQVCRAEGSLGEATYEDDATKGAARAYALHYERAAREDAAA